MDSSSSTKRSHLDMLNKSEGQPPNMDIKKARSSTFTLSQHKKKQSSLNKQNTSPYESMVHGLFSTEFAPFFIDTKGDLPLIDEMEDQLEKDIKRKKGQIKRSKFLERTEIASSRLKRKHFSLGDNSDRTNDHSSGNKKVRNSKPYSKKIATTCDQTRNVQNHKTQDQLSNAITSTNLDDDSDDYEVIDQIDKNHCYIDGQKKFDNAVSTAPSQDVEKKVQDHGPKQTSSELIFVAKSSNSTADEMISQSSALGQAEMREQAKLMSYTQTRLPHMAWPLELLSCQTTITQRIFRVINEDDNYDGEEPLVDIPVSSSDYLFEPDQFLVPNKASTEVAQLELPWFSAPKEDN